jgi:hypothetical protein
MRVWLETAKPPAWKGANDEKVYFFVCGLNPSIRIRAFVYAAQGKIL